MSARPPAARARLSTVALVSATLLAALPAAAEEQPPAEVPPVAVAWSYSADSGITFKSDPLPAVELGRTIELSAEGEFTVDDPEALGAVTITLSGPAGGMATLRDSELGKMGRFHCPLLFEAQVRLNGQEASLALPGLAYDSFLLDGSKLVKGKNVLSVKGLYCNLPRNLTGITGDPLVPGFIVKTVERQKLDFQLGPVLGVAGTNFFTVTCRVNQPATVTATATPLTPAQADPITPPASPRGLYHRFRIPLPAGTRTVSYALTATADGGTITKSTGPLTARLPDFTGKTLRFAAMGQSDGGPWPKVAEAAAKMNPDLVIHTGIFNYFPQMEGCWNGILGPAEVRAMTSTLPIYPVRGYSEFGDGVYDRMFFTPVPEGTRTENWTAVVGPVRFVAIDGFQDWSEKSPHLIWLEGVLKKATERFVFVISTYPAYSNARWVRSPAEIILQMRNVVSPLLGRYEATALLSSFGHQYERCEVPPDKGVPCIVTAASGGLAWKASGRASNLNPYSAVYVRRQHFCLFEIDGNTCTLKACDMGGQPFDTRVFTARSGTATR